MFNLFLLHTYIYIAIKLNYNLCFIDVMVTDACSDMYLLNLPL